MILFIAEGSIILKMQNGSFEWLGGPFDNSDYTQKSFVISMAVDNKGNLIAGGSFDKAGNTPANYIARWNGNYWENLGGGTNGYVSAIAPGNGGRLYIGGVFTLAGGKVSSYFAEWNEPYYQWLPVIDN